MVENKSGHSTPDGNQGGRLNERRKEKAMISNQAMRLRQLIELESRIAWIENLRKAALEFSESSAYREYSEEIATLEKQKTVLENKINRQ